MRPPIIVTTVGHSGSSALMEILHKCGMFVGDVHKTGDKNYWEHKFLQARNVGRIEGNEHFDRARFLHLPETYVPRLDAGAAVALHNQIYLRLQGEGLEGDQPWGWKDPRTVMTFDNWRKVFPKAKWIFLDRKFQDVLLDPFTYGKVPGLLEFWRGRFQRNYDLLPDESKFFLHYDHVLEKIEELLSWAGLERKGLRPDLWRPKYDGVYE